MLDNMEKEYQVIIKKGEIAFVAECPKLGVVSQGNTEKEALANIKEAIELFLEEENMPTKLKESTLKKAKVCSVTLTG